MKKLFVNLISTAFLFALIYVPLSIYMLDPKQIGLNLIIAEIILAVVYFVISPIISKAFAKHAGGGWELEGKQRLISFGVYALILLLIVITNK